jgi:hypothetical protein
MRFRCVIVVVGIRGARPSAELCLRVYQSPGSRGQFTSWALADRASDTNEHAKRITPSEVDHRSRPVQTLIGARQVDSRKCTLRGDAASIRGQHTVVNPAILAAVLTFQYVDPSRVGKRKQPSAHRDFCAGLNEKRLLAGQQLHHRQVFALVRDGTVYHTLHHLLVLCNEDAPFVGARQRLGCVTGTG